jgi:hypothetical protein
LLPRTIISKYLDLLGSGNFLFSVGKNFFMISFTFGPEHLTIARALLPPGVARLIIVL